MATSRPAEADYVPAAPIRSGSGDGATRVWVDVRRCIDCGQFYTDNSRISKSKIFGAYVLGGPLVGLMVTGSEASSSCPRCGSRNVSNVESLELVIPPSTAGATVEETSLKGPNPWMMFGAIVPLAFIVILAVSVLTESLLAVMATAGLVAAILYLSVSMDRIRRL